MLAKTPAGFLPLLSIGVPAGVMRNYVSRKKVREGLMGRWLIHELDELEGLGSAVAAVHLARKLHK